MERSYRIDRSSPPKAPGLLPLRGKCARMMILKQIRTMTNLIFFTRYKSLTPRCRSNGSYHSDIVRQAAQREERTAVKTDYALVTRLSALPWTWSWRDSVCTAPADWTDSTTPLSFVWCWCCGCCCCAVSAGSTSRSDVHTPQTLHLRPCYVIDLLKHQGEERWRRTRIRTRLSEEWSNENRFIAVWKNNPRKGQM